MEMESENREKRRNEREKNAAMQLEKTNMMI